MRREDCELAVLGAGFAGSLLAILARRLGHDVVLLERGRHPRFAIGESSTPLANLKLQALSRAYGLDWLEPLAKYGPWKRTYPQLACGLKRGFSFFRHQPGLEFTPAADHANELLVGANPDAERGDTHWFRQDLDAFLVERAVQSGVTYVDLCSVERIERQDGWRLRGARQGQPVEVRARFVADATGEGGVLAPVLGLMNGAPAVRTSTRALFSHFSGVARWSDVLDARSAPRGEHPFPCDAAALHHVIDDGWMWVLRFDNGITSAGFSLPAGPAPREASRTAEDEWAWRLAAYPSIARQFEGAAAVRPLVRTQRLQRRLSRAAGPDWVVLPHGAGFVDPWLSPGIAHSLYGLERLLRIICERRSFALSERDQAGYSDALFREFEIIDRITAACFASFGRFPVLVAMTMLYFAAATSCEERLRGGAAGAGEDFLLAHDRRFRALVENLTDAAGRVRPPDAALFAEQVRQRLAPYNGAGLCDPARRNMYAHAPTSF